MIRRDNRVGRALGRLEVPEHREGFFDVLEAEMTRADSGERGTPELDSREIGLSRSRVRLLTRRRVSVGLAVVAVAATVLAFAGPLADLATRGGRMAPLAPAVASAAEVAAKVESALEGVTSLRGELVLIEPGAPDGMRWEFVTTSAGDFRLTGSASAEDGEVTEARAYEAAAGTERGFSTGDSASGRPIAWTRRGLAAGIPDQAASDLVQRRLVGIVRALREMDDARVTEIEHDGRKAWKLSADVEPNKLADGAPDHIEITVDRETGFPVKVVQTAGGARVSEARLENLEIDPQLPPDAFSVSVPEDAEHYEEDMGFRRGDVTAAAKAVGYDPLLPGRLPDGYELAEVTYADTAGPTGKEGGNPPSRGVVSVAYRRGFDTVVVSTRLVRKDASAWTDPLSLGEGFIDRPERVELSSGEFDGSVAEVLIDPRGVPHLWAMNEDLVLTVAGDVTREELLLVAESMSGKAAATD